MGSSHTYSDFKAAGGYNIRRRYAKMPASAVSVAITGIASGDLILDANAVKFSGTAVTGGKLAVKTCANLTAGNFTIGTNKVIPASAYACSNGLLCIDFLDLT